MRVFPLELLENRFEDAIRDTVDIGLKIQALRLQFSCNAMPAEPLAFGCFTLRWIKANVMEGAGTTIAAEHFSFSTASSASVVIVELRKSLAMTRQRMMECCADFDVDFEEIASIKSRMSAYLTSIIAQSICITVATRARLTGCSWFCLLRPTPALS